jgi:fermentation-respiration switch protein FrsA (DUF1100 family)
MSEVEHNPDAAPTKPTLNQRIFGSWQRVLKALVFFYVALVGAMVVMESSLLYPSPSGGNWDPAFSHEDVEFASADGTNLHSWIIRSNSQRETPRYILYCHGNGENVALAAGWSVLEIIEKLDANVMVFDYRGYGKSEGSPHEAGIKLDAEKALDVFCETMGVETSDVTLVGHSLGGGVAAHLASTRGCKALVLQKTFSSLPDVAASKYPYVPVRLLMRNRFDSVSAIKEYTGPLFQSHGDQDNIIPFRFGKKLFDAKSPRESDSFMRLAGFGHNDGFPPEYWVRLGEWMTEIESADVQ